MPSPTSPSPEGEVVAVVVVVVVVGALPSCVAAARGVRSLRRTVERSLASLALCAGRF